MGLSRKSLEGINGKYTVDEYERNRAERALEIKAEADRINELMGKARKEGHVWLGPDAWRRIKVTGEVPAINQDKTEDKGNETGLLSKVKGLLGKVAVEEPKVVHDDVVNSAHLDQLDRGESAAPLPRRKPSQE